ncbi:MAG TPA: polymer-forming cytoskeletal protein [Gemmatimonadales bacterium]|nr:polymer-forming cytoskeletal protein [Gemmatimonadales bacterium]
MAIFSNPPADAEPAKPPFNRRKGDGIPLSIIARDMTVTGDMETEGVVKVEGRVKGTIRATSQIIISPGSSIEGDLHTKEAVVAGEIQGTIRAAERVELQATALVRGDIYTPRISVIEGGRVSGEVNMAAEAPVKKESEKKEKLISS